jgi:hypothetical protein
MKKISILFIGIFIVLASSNVFSEDKWPELEAFHKIMSATFHPSEEGNFEPIKTRIGELVEAAAKMNTSTVPAEFNKPEILETSKKMEADARALEEKIKANATNEDIKKDLVALHDTFHKIVGLCNPKEEHKDDNK